MINGQGQSRHQAWAWGPPWNRMVRKFSHFDSFCSQNLQTMSANYFSFWGTL